MGKASDFDKRMEGRFLQPGQLWPIRPEVRVRPDAPSMEVDKTTPVQNVLGRLGSGERGVVLREASGEAAAVVLSAERYAELAGCEVESEQRFRAFEGKIEPSPSALEELMIEQVDPDAEWKFSSRIWPLKPEDPKQ